MVPLSSFKDASSVSTITSILQQNGKLEDEVCLKIPCLWNVGLLGSSC